MEWNGWAGVGRGVPSAVMSEAEVTRCPTAGNVSHLSGWHWGGGVGTGGRVMFSGCGEARHRGIPWAVCAERSLRLCAPVVCWPAVVLRHYGVWGVWRVRLLQGDAHCLENGAQGPCHGEWGWVSDKSVPCSALHAGWPSLPS